MTLETTDQPKAVVLLSGGLDSATTAAIAKEQGFALYALSFLYGQRHALEERAAVRIAKSLGARQHVIQHIDLRAFGASALTGDIDVPKPADLESRPPDIPVTYVPARNTIFLSIALAYAEVIDASDIFIGINAVDYSGYPDCRPEYLEQFQRLANLATRAAVEGACIRINAPLITYSKADIIRQGRRLGVDYRLTHSCYDPDPSGRACGRCESCLFRLEGFREAGVDDPIDYAPI